MKITQFLNRSCGSWVGKFWFGLGLHSYLFIGLAMHSVLFASSLYCTTTWHQPALVEVSLTSVINWLQTENRKQTHSSIYRVAPATKNT